MNGNATDYLDLERERTLFEENVRAIERRGKDRQVSLPEGIERFLERKNRRHCIKGKTARGPLSHKSRANGGG